MVDFFTLFDLFAIFTGFCGLLILSFCVGGFVSALHVAGKGFATCTTRHATNFRTNGTAYPCPNRPKMLPTAPPSIPPQPI